MTNAILISLEVEGLKQSTQKGGHGKVDKVSITITTDKPVKIKVEPNDESAAEKDGLARLLRDVKGGNAHVVSSGKDKPSDK